MNTIRHLMTGLCAVLALAGCTRSAVEPGDASPALAKMKLATPAHSNIGVPVDVRYQLSGVVAKDQPANLDLAFVPRIEGAALRIEFPESPTVTFETGNSPMAMQKAQAAGVYRRSLVVTPRGADGGDIQVIVSMDVEGGRYFSIFTVPVREPAPINQ